MSASLAIAEAEVVNFPLILNAVPAELFLVEVEAPPASAPFSYSLNGAEAPTLDANDPSACEDLFRQLVAQHQSRLYRFISKYVDHPDDAADIAQQAFAEAARTIATFRGDSKLSTWLFGIAMNMVRNYLSRAPHRIHKFETDESLAGLMSSDIDPGEHVAQREMLQLVIDAIKQHLPTEMREVLMLVAIDEISYQDVATMLRIPLGTVRSRVSRARAVLRAHFERTGVAVSY
jgi:RNA polymerase sigma factor (sigma-70 family)